MKQTNEEHPAPTSYESRSKARTIPRRVLAVGLGMLGVICLCLAGVFASPDTNRGFNGPVRSLIASWEWTRFHREESRGDWQEAYFHARRALRLDSRAPAGWSTLASHFLFLRASAENEPNPEARMQWIVRGLRVLREGQAASSQPGELLLTEGQTLTFWIAGLAESGDLPWPGGGQAAWQMGMRRLGLAQEKNHPQAHQLLELARKVAFKTTGSSRGNRPEPRGPVRPDGEPASIPPTHAGAPVRIHSADPSGWLVKRLDVSGQKSMQYSLWVRAKLPPSCWAYSKKAS